MDRGNLQISLEACDKWLTADRETPGAAFITHGLFTFGCFLNVASMNQLKSSGIRDTQQIHEGGVVDDAVPCGLEQLFEWANGPLKP